MPTHYQGTAEEIRALNTFIKLTRALHAFTGRVLSHGAIEGLTESQFAVLEGLLHLGPMCQGSLSRKLLTSTGNMTLVLDNLEKRNLVRRVRSEQDRRMVQIELTEQGRATIERIFPRHAAALAHEMQVLTPAEQDELARLAKKLGLGADCEPAAGDPAEIPLSVEASVEGKE